MVESGNPRVFFEVTIGSRVAGKIEFELFQNIVPRTVENFRCLCTGEKGLSKITKVPLHYKNSRFHRLIPGFMIQGGDFTKGDGTGGESIYGARFDDENFNLRHNAPGLLSMANVGKNTNASQFFITLGPAAWLDGKHVVFGKVISGQSVLVQMERIVTGANDVPKVSIVISNCGLVMDETNESNQSFSEISSRYGDASTSTSSSSSTTAPAISAQVPDVKPHMLDQRKLPKILEEMQLPVSFGRKFNQPSKSSLATGSSRISEHAAP